MTVQDIVSQLNLTVCSGQEGLQREVKGGYTSDLLSDVMGHAQEGDAPQKRRERAQLLLFRK